MSQMDAARRLTVLSLILIMLLASGAPAEAQGSDTVQHFPETGHTVRGEFLSFYRTASNPGLVFGYPITEQITSKDGTVVQYFQRARLELRTEMPQGQRVQLTALGTANYKPGSQQLDIDNSAACRLFPSGFRVCFAFLDFYEANGGAVQFGNPISPFEFHENLIVQYFEKARFEWRADRPDGQRVVLSDLGRLHFDRLREDQAHLKPVSPLDATISSVLAINARAFVSKAITLSSGQQTVYVVVQSQTHQPVSNATGKATVRFAEGQTQDYYFSTNASGLGSITFQFADQKQGDLVLVDIVVTYQGFPATTATSFRIWF
jgi:hypothetical protein